MNHNNDDVVVTVAGSEILQVLVTRPLSFTEVCTCTYNRAIAELSLETRRKDEQ
jgi:hypothetical protein